MSASLGALLSARRFATRITAPAGQAASRPAGAGSPRWPFLRNKALSEKLMRCFAPGPDATPRQLWITGAKGSGAGTAVQAVATQAMRSADGASAAVVLFDCSPDVQHRITARTTVDVVTKLSFTLQSQLAERFNTDSASTAVLQIEAIVGAIIADHPEAVPALAEVIESVGNRLGLPGALQAGTEVQGCRDALAQYRNDPQKLVVHAAESIKNSAMRQKRQLGPATAVHAALAILREAGVRVAAKTSSADGYKPVTCLLTAAAALAKTASRDILLILMRADALTEGQRDLGRDLLAIVDPFISAEGSERTRGCGLLRLLVQSSDGVAAARTHSRGVDVLTADAWSEEMARAIFVPRYLEPEHMDAWQAIWASVGGHPAHLRRVAELIIDEKKSIELARFKEAQDKQKVEALRKFRPERSEDAEKFGQLADEQHEVDSLRYDARKPQSIPESLMRRLPEVLDDEVKVFESQVSSLSRHPVLNSSLGHSNEKSADWASALRYICMQPCIYAPTPRELGSIEDPLLLAMLDVGLLVPKFSEPGGPRLVVANQLTRSLLLSWIDAHCSELSWLSWFKWQGNLWSHRHASSHTTVEANSSSFSQGAT